MILHHMWDWNTVINGLISSNECSTLTLPCMWNKAWVKRLLKIQKQWKFWFPMEFALLFLFLVTFGFRSNRIWTVFSLPFMLRFSWNFQRILPREGGYRILNCILIILNALFRKVTLLSYRLGMLFSVCTKR